MNTDDVTELNANLLPAQGNFMWRSRAAALNGCIYFMSSYANHMKKLDASNNDEISSVDDLGDDGRFKRIGMVVRIDGTCPFEAYYQIRSNQ